VAPALAATGWKRLRVSRRARWSTPLPPGQRDRYDDRVLCVPIALTQRRRDGVEVSVGQRATGQGNLSEESAGVLGPSVRISAGGSSHQRIDLLGKRRNDGRGRWNVVVNVLVSDLNCALAPVGLGARQHLEEQDPGRIHV
jgi:hypothetical protein